MVYDYPRFDGDIGAAKCLLCSHRIWEPVKVVVPYIPPFVDQRRSKNIN